MRPLWTEIKSEMGYEASKRTCEKIVSVEEGKSIKNAVEKANYFNKFYPQQPSSIKCLILILKLSIFRVGEIKHLLLFYFYLSQPERLRR